MPGQPPPHQPQPHTVFVSHAHADNALADRYVAALRKRGLDVWYDRSNLQGGQRLGKEIERELEQRTALVVLLTPASVPSYWVDMEVSAFRDLAAHDASRLLLPVRIADCAVPLLMRGLFWIDAVSLGFDAAVDAMAKALGAPIPMTPQQAKSVADLIEHGRRLMEQGEDAEAIRYFERATQLNPESSIAWCHLGYLYILVVRYQEALTACERALALNPNDAAAWQYMGSTFRMLGRPQEALAAYDRAQALNPDSVLARSGKKLVQRALGLDAEAEEATAKELVASKEVAEQQPAAASTPNVAPDHTGVVLTVRTIKDEVRYIEWMNKGRELINTGNFDEALAAYEEALALDPTNAEAWLGKGNALFADALHFSALHRSMVPDYASALAAYERAVALDPNNGLLALRVRASCREILEASERELARDPDDAICWSCKGWALSILGRRQEALAAYEEALAGFERWVTSEPSNPFGWLGKESALRRLGRTDEAKTAKRMAEVLGVKDASS